LRAVAGNKVFMRYACGAKPIECGKFNFGSNCRKVRKRMTGSS
jgi:hypothetical protein